MLYKKIIDYTNIWINNPDMILIASRIPTIFSVSLIFSLCLQRTSMPSPALDKSPDITAPKLIEPFIKSIVNAIETAQFGINPKNAVITGSKNLTFPNNKCNTEWFAYTVKTKFSNIVIIKINTKILSVCFSG